MARKIRIAERMTTLPFCEAQLRRPSTTISSARRQLCVFDLDHANCDEARRNAVNIAKRQSCCGMDAPLEPRSDGPTCRRISFRLRLRISATGVLRFTDRQTPLQR